MFLVKLSEKLIKGDTLSRVHLGQSLSDRRIDVFHGVSDVA